MNSAYQYTDSPILVNAPNVTYTDDTITADYVYHTSEAKIENGQVVVTPRDEKYVFKTDRRIPKVGMMLIGWGGNNGTTVTAGILANKHQITWHTKKGEMHPNYYGSISQSSTVKIGTVPGGDLYIPFKNLLPLVNPNDLVIGGWDISSMNLGDAMKRAGVYDYDFQQVMYPYMKDFKPLPSIYYPDYIAANQKDRADNVIPGNDKQVHLDTVRADMRRFKEENHLDKVIVLWTANTERYSEIIPGVNDTAENLLKSIRESHSEVAPSTIFAVAAILEGTPLTHRAVTVSGGAVKRPRNLWVPIGTPLRCLLESAGGLRESAAVTLTGGPMAGQVQEDLEAPVVKNTNGLICLTEQEHNTAAQPEMVCVRCGHCVSSCPMNLNPVLVYRAMRMGETERLPQLNLEDCLECGCCTYICPSRIPLLDLVRQAKDLLKEGGENHG